MPIYEFTCSDCGHQEAILKKLGDRTATCPQCHSLNFKKVISPCHGRVAGIGAPRTASQAPEREQKTAPSQGFSCAHGRASKLIKSYEKQYRVPEVHGK
ncbi:FmdB family zinc ribbon protein [Pseudobacteriovorax antillogorgiicola]|uniref:Putative regulatory protein, FmdB family n=1 Tax=Pseudobacteriovorax antillogorgiicola TaxID=1513793 RepID=A0A1Y6BCK7_9BACT|nr:zinc ribbon domain-containing protein [Pseudobacteriovorax antillogorgiicola]TCS57330.1 putative FmdB family regulatory protein [Pseudobacteriovorax antillogorgiicola]SMF02430.1 putative regulatory protein, FmdB family [Pseudobacteriovorax antillogorgiicola]